MQFSFESVWLQNQLYTGLLEYTYTSASVLTKLSPFLFGRLRCGCVITYEAFTTNLIVVVPL